MNHLYVLKEVQIAVRMKSSEIVKKLSWFSSCLFLSRFLIMTRCTPNYQKGGTISAIRVLTNDVTTLADTPYYFLSIELVGLCFSTPEA